MTTKEAIREVQRRKGSALTARERRVAIAQARATPKLLCGPDVERAYGGPPKKKKHQIGALGLPSDVHARYVKYSVESFRSSERSATAMVQKGDCEGAFRSLLASQASAQAAVSHFVSTETFPGKAGAEEIIDSIRSDLRRLENRFSNQCIRRP